MQDDIHLKTDAGFSLPEARKYDEGYLNFLVVLSTLIASVAAAAILGAQIAGLV